MDTIAEVRNLSVLFKTDEGVVRAVDGLDFVIRKGETLGIVGESGCGKSMTASALMGLIPKAGEIGKGSTILFDGINVVSANREQLWHIRGDRAAMIFQEPMTSLNPVFKIGDQIREALELHRSMTRCAMNARVVELLSLVGIASPERIADSYPHTLSGGMRQRVMIAMALACDPELLLADEPTTALDVTIQAQILELMKDLKRKVNASILLISHNMGVIAEMCDRIIVMYAGKAVEEGHARDIFATPLHPYTEGLLRSIPSVVAKRDRLDSIPGMVPNPLNMPSGCAFYPRCPYARPSCSEAMPELLRTGEGRAVRCFLRGSGTKERSAS